MENKFFDEQTPSSMIKAKIVAEYFPQYSRILLKRPQPEIRYLDLFAGPGLYKDGNHSTPLLLASTCASDSLLAQKVHLIFNDNEYSAELKDNFQSHFPVDSFAFAPKFGEETVGESDKVREYLIKEEVKPNPHPTLLFFDPWGYKGIDTQVLAKFLANWGNEIFLFVNIKRIHAAIANNKFDELMESLFPTTIEKLRNDRKYTAKVHERLSLIMDNLAQEFEKAVEGALYSCAFKFQEEDSVATSHFIIHFTKHSKGYELIKQVYYGFDNIGATLEKDGVYTFDAKRMGKSAESAMNFGDQNVEILSEQIVSKYKGRTISAKDLFEDHHTSTQYCGSHYVKTLRELVEQNRVNSTFTDSAGHKVSVLLTDSCILKFS